MGELISKKINKYMYILFSIIIIFFIIFAYQNKYEKNVKEEKQIIKQIKDYHDGSEKSRSIAETLFKEDYLNRAVAIEAMLDQISGNITIENLQYIAKLMNIESISLIDDKGVIINSSNDKLIGQSALKQEANTNFKELFYDKNKKSSIDLYGKSILDNEEDSSYIGLRTNDNRYNVLQIKVKRDQLEQLTSPLVLKTIIKNTPTIYEKAIFLVDKKTTKITAITKNNEQYLNFDNYDEQENFIRFLESFNEGRYTVINNQEKLLVTGDLGDCIVGITVDSMYIYKSVFYYILYIFTICLFIFIVVNIILKYCLHEFILKDIHNINLTIQDILSGEDKVHFVVKYDTELKYLCRLLQVWKNNYEAKLERFKFLSKNIDKNIAIYLCLSDINRSFFSKNLKEILEISEESWKQYKTNPDKYKSYIKQIIKEYMDNEGFIRINKKYLKITYFEGDNNFYGVVYDKTEEILQKEKVDKVIEESEHDDLTSLANRKKIEFEAKNFFAEEEHEGALIIFDLDNFKQINDNEGHLEGDNVLKIFAECLIKIFKKEDIVSRAGGDEFIVLMKNNIPKYLLEQKLDGLLEDFRIRLNKYVELYKISCSIGAVFIDKNIKTYREAYQYADAGLYIAKREGRNRYFINTELINCMNVKYKDCKTQCSRRKVLFGKD